MDTKKIAGILWDAYTDAETTFEELSQKTGIPKSAIHRYMSGETEKIPLDRFEALCKALGLDASSILGWKPISWDHTIHEMPVVKAPDWIEVEPKRDKTKIYNALSALARTDKEAAASLFLELVDQGVL